MDPTHDQLWSVCLSNAGNMSKRIDMSSHFFDGSVWASFYFSSSTAVTKVQGEPPHLLNTNRKSLVTDRSTSVPMTLSDLEGEDAKGQTFLDDLLN